MIQTLFLLGFIYVTCVYPEFTYLFLFEFIIITISALINVIYSTIIFNFLFITLNNTTTLSLDFFIYVVLYTFLFLYFIYYIILPSSMYNSRTLYIIYYNISCWFIYCNISFI